MDSKYQKLFEDWTLEWGLDPDAAHGGKDAFQRQEEVENVLEEYGAKSGP